MTIVEKDLVLLEYAQMLEQAVNAVIPGVLSVEIREEKESAIDLQMGVIIGLTGNVRGKLILSGSESTFQGISEMMYGMRLDGPMLESFAGELGNMIGGNFSIGLSQINVPIDITAPTIMQGNTRISGYRSGVKIEVQLQNHSQVELYFLQDN